MWDSTLSCLTPLDGQDAWKDSVRLEGLTGPRAHTPVELVLWPLTGRLLSLTLHIMEN